MDEKLELNGNNITSGDVARSALGDRIGCGSAPRDSCGYKYGNGSGSGPWVSLANGPEVDEDG